MTNEELKYAISLTLADHAGDFNIEGIAEAVREEYPEITKLDDVPTVDYWEIVKAYDASDVASDD